MPETRHTVAPWLEGLNKLGAVIQDLSQEELYFKKEEKEEEKIEGLANSDLAPYDDPGWVNFFFFRCSCSLWTWSDDQGRRESGGVMGTGVMDTHTDGYVPTEGLSNDGSNAHRHLSLSSTLGE